jgi:hypothetical protein
MSSVKRPRPATQVVKRHPPKPADPKLLQAPVPYRAARSRRVFGIGR